MLTVDTSVVIAILRKESGYEKYVWTIVEAEAAYLSSINLLECYLVLGERGNEADALISDAEIVIRDFTFSTCQIARSAFLRYGKGRHKAALNICDCAAYATAKESGSPLLYKGDGFSLTDIVPAM